MPKVADAIVKIVDRPFRKRPFRVHVDPTEDGAEVTRTGKHGFHFIFYSFRASAAHMLSPD